MLRRFCVGVLALASVAALVGCQGLVKGVSSLTVNVAGGDISSGDNSANQNAANGASSDAGSSATTNQDGGQTTG